MFRKSVLHNIPFKQNTKQGKLVFGILGTQKGAGVTHFSILMANYLSDYLGKNTAYLQYYTQKDIGYLSEYVYREKKDDKEPFQVNGITFYPNMKEQDIAEISGDYYNYIILDLGTEFNKCKNEFLRCDIKIIISSLAIWKRYELDQFIHNSNHIKNNEHWNYAIPFARERDIKQVSKDFGKKFYKIPFEPDPFALSQETIQLFQKLI